MQIGAVGRLDHPSMVNTLSDRPSGGALADRQCRIADFVRREGQVRGCRSSPDLGIRYARRSAPSRPSRRAARSRRCRPLPWCGPGVALGGSRCPWSCAGPARWLRPLTGGRRDRACRARLAGLLGLVRAASGLARGRHGHPHRIRGAPRVPAGLRSCGGPARQPRPGPLGQDVRPSHCGILCVRGRCTVEPVVSRILHSRPSGAGSTTGRCASAPTRGARLTPCTSRRVIAR